MANIPYTPFSTEQSGGGGGTPFSVRATPNDFGAQVGAEVEKSGKEGFEIAQKQQGMINETAMTNADADFATRIGKIKGDYISLSGMAAYNAFPKYQEDIKSAFQETRSTLPPAAQRGFDMMAVRSMANHVADGSSYASSQLKEANRDSFSNVADVNLQALLDPQVASNPERANYHIDTLRFAAEAQIDDEHPGLKKDPETGTVSFNESTPEGQQAKIQFQQRLDTYLSQGYVNRYDTLAKQDVFGGWDAYQQERDKMPKSAQVALDASFGPRILDAHKQIATSSTLIKAQQDHFEVLTNPSSGSAIDTVIKNEGGYVPVDGSSGAPAIYGINAKAHPEAYAQIKRLTDESGPEVGETAARSFYKTEYYDKKGIADLPANTQSIVMDGVVNHSKDFGNKLIQAAKNGSSPQELVQMRRDEYQRLATSNPAKYGDSLAGWNNRLDNLQQSTGGNKTYATNENGGPLSLADYYRTNSKEILAKGDAYAEKQMPGDLALKRLVRQTLTNEMGKTISNENAQHTLDNRNVMRAINGELTKGKLPETEDELRAILGMGDLLDNIAARDPKFSATIPTMIEKMARRNDVTNSSNGYETILRTLQPNDYDHPNRIANQDHLTKLLGHSDGTGINMKDYNDAKKVIDKSDKWKSFLSKNMKEITNANGNLDGNGQERAIAWYNQITDARSENDSKGDKALSEAQFIANINDKLHPLAPSPPSRMQQISNWASSLVTNKQPEIPVLTDKSQFNALKNGDLYIRNGIQYRKP